MCEQRDPSGEATAADFPPPCPPDLWLAPVVLEGTRVRLEPLGRHHADALCGPALDGMPTVWFPRPLADRADVVDYVEEGLAAQAAGQALPFVTVDRMSGRVAGATRFGAAVRRDRRVEIGWTFLGTAHHGTGMNTEAKLLMLRHAFDVWSCLRVEFKTDRLNARSRAAIAALGARAEGEFRHHVVCADGRLRDTVWYAILRADWPVVERHLVRRLHAQTEIRS